ncbi:putative rIIB [Vibrio phage 424E50-1]|nr:putative rIIB [Vibrio phage 424E50-1]
MARTNIVKCKTEEDKLDIFAEYQQGIFSSKKELASAWRISTRTLNRILDEVAENSKPAVPSSKPVSALKEMSVEDIISKVEQINVHLRGEVGDVTVEGTLYYADYDYAVTKKQITVMKDGESRSVVKGYPRFNEIKESLVDNDFSDTILAEVWDLMNLPKYIEKFTQGSLTVSHEEGKVWYGTFEIKNSLSDQLIKMLNEGKEVTGFVKFMEMLLENPKQDIVEELYGFMEHNGIGIDNEGYILAYKGVRGDYLDRWTGTISNAVGESPSMPASMVEHNPKKPCGAGLHAGSFEYADSWAGSEGHVMLLRIPPQNVMSVPWDTDSQKMRTCGYDVLEEIR